MNERTDTHGETLCPEHAEYVHSRYETLRELQDHLNGEDLSDPNKWVVVMTEEMNGLIGDEHMFPTIMDNAAMTLIKVMMECQDPDVRMRGVITMARLHKALGQTLKQLEKCLRKDNPALFDKIDELVELVNQQETEDENCNS